MKSTHLNKEGVASRAKQVAFLLGNVNAYQRAEVLHAVADALMAQKRELFASAIHAAATAYASTVEGTPLDDLEQKF